MRLADERYEEIKSSVVDMLVRIHERGYPLHTKSVIRALGGIVVPYSDIADETKRMLKEEFSKDGFQLTKDGHLYVFYNDSICVGRYRYTLMHEVGHYWLGHTCTSKLAESEADFFAKYSLAPPVVVNYYECRDYIHLMSVFHLSEEAAKYAWNLYVRWLNRDGDGLSEQEKRLCRLLDIRQIIRKHREELKLER